MNNCRKEGNSRSNRLLRPQKKQYTTISVKVLNLYYYIWICTDMECLFHTSKSHNYLYRNYIKLKSDIQKSLFHFPCMYISLLLYRYWSKHNEGDLSKLAQRKRGVAESCNVTGSHWRFQGLLKIEVESNNLP